MVTQPKHDLELLAAIGDVKAAVRLVPTGRVFLEVHRLAGVTVDHRVSREPLTERDIQTLMTQRPCPRRARAEIKERGCDAE